jgi:hypothetical protein
MANSSFDDLPIRISFYGQRSWQSRVEVVAAHATAALRQRQYTVLLSQDSSSCDKTSAATGAVRATESAVAVRLIVIHYDLCRSVRFA